MLFNSLTYLTFMLIAAPLVIFGPQVVRRTMLLVGSVGFYAFWRVDFTLLALFSCLLDYYVAQRIAVSTTPTARKAWLLVSVVTQILLLGFFKYTYFIVGTTQSIFSVLGLPFEVTLPHILLPLGISFYTFQTMSYTIDVYRGVQKPVTDLVLFISFVMFWPQLVAGPILRADEVVPQLKSYSRPRAADLTLGIEQILHGLFIKAVLADTIADVVEYGFDQPTAALGTLDVWTLAFAFGLQIYFDFAGYSQIALGSARVMGFNFPRNFNWPYLACSPRDFWKRWHISLSSWIRDYLYLPLMGVKVKPKHSDSRGGLEVATQGRKDRALFLTWFIMGLWHGANWTFAIWGLWHALLIFLYRVSEPLRVRLPNWLRLGGGWAITLALCMLGWLFFRCQSVAGAFEMLFKAFDPTQLTRLSMRENNYLITFIFFIGLLLVGAVVRLDRAARIPTVLRVGAMTMANAVIFFSLFLMLRPVKQFIYFQF